MSEANRLRAAGDQALGRGDLDGAWGAYTQGLAAPAISDAESGELRLARAWVCQARGGRDAAEIEVSEAILCFERAGAADRHSAALEQRGHLRWTRAHQRLDHADHADHAHAHDHRLDDPDDRDLQGAWADLSAALVEADPRRRPVLLTTLARLRHFIANADRPHLLPEGDDRDAQLARAQEELRGAVAAFAAAGDRRGQVSLLVQEGERLLRAGAPAQAAAWLAEAAPLEDQVDPWTRATARLVRAELALAQGDRATAQALLDALGAGPLPPSLSTRRAGLLSRLSS